MFAVWVVFYCCLFVIMCLLAVGITGFGFGVLCVVLVCTLCLCCFVCVGVVVLFGVGLFMCLFMFGGVFGVLLCLCCFVCLVVSVCVISVCVCVHVCVVVV